MDDTLLGSLARAVLYTLLIVFFIATLAFTYNSITLNSYMTQATEVITRSGGLSKKAYQDLNDISAQHYHGMFHVSKTDDADRQESGWKGSDENLTSVVADTGNPEDLSDNKGFTDAYDNNDNEANDAKQNYMTAGELNGLKFGDEHEYYVYIDIPYMNNMVYHSSLHSGSAPIGLPVQSSIRSNSQR